MLTRFAWLVALLSMRSLAQGADGGADAGAPWSVNEPGAPFRDVPIDVTEGTWMSVDVNAKGEIAFDLLGDLYLLPPGGGEARALTQGAAWDMQPRFSPDGTSLAFTSDRGGGDNLWVLPLVDGGVPTQVSKEPFRLLNSPTWSPDGRTLVARKHFTSRRSLGAGELWLFHRTGGEGVQLTEKQSDQKDLGEPAFSPDGRYVYFSQDVSPGKTFEYNKDPNGEIYDIQRLELETRELTRFVTGPGGSVRPTPSPDGRSLAFVRRARGVSVLMVMDVVSGAERVVYDGLDRDLQETWAIHGVAPAMAWTRDSKALVFSAKGSLWKLDVATRAATKIPFHVKTTRRLFETVRSPQVAVTDEVKVKMARWSRVSPKGDVVVFEALGKLWRKALPNGAPTRLTRQSKDLELMPSWSRDGATLVYATWNDEALGTIRQVAASGGEGKVLTTGPGHYVEPVLSPDGKTLVYRVATPSLLRSALFDREPGLFVVSLAGGKPKRLSRDGEDPHFADQSDRVYFLSVNDEGKEDVRALKSIGLDGSDERTHATSDEATEYRVSPDGKWLAWRENFNAFLMPFPRGAKALVADPDTKALPVAKLSRDCGEWLGWSGDSSALHWSWGGQLFTRTLGDAFAFVSGRAKVPEPPVTGTPLGLSAKSYVAKGVVAFVGGRVITMKGDEVIDDGTVVLRDGRIEAVGPRANVKVPAGAKVFDVKGKTVMPGLVDVHWHGGVGSDGIVPQQNWVLLAGLAFGVTTAHDPSNDTETFFSAAERSRIGDFASPRLFSTGTILYGAQGSFRAVVNSLDDARAHLRRMQAAGAFSVKSYGQPRREQRQQVLQAARELGMLVVPEGASLLQHNLTMVVDGHTGVEHAIPVSKAYDDVAQLWSQSGTGWTPTLGVAYGGWWGENYWYEKDDVWADPRLTRFVPRRLLDARSRRRTKAPDDEVNHVEVARIAKQLNDRGVLVQLGAHGQREGLAAHWELWSFALGGMSNLQALRAGTLNGARYLGLDRDLGSLEVGKLGDLLVLDQNPLENIRFSRSVRLTVVGGRVWNSETMDEVWPREAKRAPLFFEREGGQAWPNGVSATATDD